MSALVSHVRCTTCDSDWTAGAFDVACAECGGGALVRPCPDCAGQCGAQWTRVVLESWDRHAASWAGTCAGPGPHVA